MTTNVYHSNASMQLDTNDVVAEGSIYILRMVALELKEWGFDKLDIPTDKVKLESLGSYREFLRTNPTFITVHHKATPFSITLPAGTERDIVALASQRTQQRLRPNPNAFLYANMGQRIESHYLVAGVPNSGKSVIAQILENALKTFEPEATIILRDIGENSYNWFAHTSPEERAAHMSYIRTLEHVFGKSPF